MRAVQQVNARFARVKRAVRDFFAVPVTITTNAVVPQSLLPRRFFFQREADKIPAFNNFLKQVIDAEILGIENGTIEPRDNWLNTTIGDAYVRGAKKARLAGERNIPTLTKLPDFSPFANPAHAERAEIIFQRVYTDLKGVTETMSAQMNRVLSEGMLRGDGVKEIAKNLNDRVDKIGATRARLIARTEVVESHNQASIQEGKNLAKDTGVEIKMLWIGVDDGRERPTHVARNNNIYTFDEAQAMIGEPNCRCSVSPVFDIDKL